MYQILQPIGQLLQMTREVSDGRMVSDRQVVIKSNDEFGHLTRSFLEMTARLKRTTVSKDYFDKILMTLPDPLIICSEMGDIIRTNSAYTELLGYGGTELAGKPIDRILSMEHWIYIHQAVVRSKLNINSYEAKYISKGGEEIDMSLSASLVVNPNTNERFLVLVARDIREVQETAVNYLTAKAQAERRLLKRAFSWLV